MKYVILIHSNPQPWGHPTGDFVAELQALPAEQRAQLEKEFDALLEELNANGELVSAEALGSPANARLYRWGPGAAGRRRAVLREQGAPGWLLPHRRGLARARRGDRRRVRDARGHDRAAADHVAERRGVLRS